MKAGSKRSLSIVTAAVFVISAAFPVGAGLSHNTDLFPRWWGYLDVGIALLLALLAMAVLGLGHPKITKRDEETTYHAYRILIHAIFVLMVAFFLFGNRITWVNCLTGFAWRGWLLLYVLPAWIAAFRSQT